jgi:hypothetical protein
VKQGIDGSKWSNQIATLGKRKSERRAKIGALPVSTSLVQRWWQGHPSSHLSGQRRKGSREGGAAHTMEHRSDRGGVKWARFGLRSYCRWGRKRSSKNNRNLDHSSPCETLKPEAKGTNISQEENPKDEERKKIRSNKKEG